MDDVAGHVAEVFGPVEELMMDGFEACPGAVEVNVKGRSQGGVLLSAWHKHLPGSASEGSLTSSYESAVGATNLAVDTTLKSSGSTEINARFDTPFGIDNTTIVTSADLNHGEGDDCFGIEASRAGDGWIHSLRAFKSTAAEEGVSLVQSASYEWKGMTAGAEGLYNGGEGRIKRVGLSLSQAVRDLVLAFRVGRACDDAGWSSCFQAGFALDITPKAQFGGLFTKSSGADSQIAVAGRCKVDENLEVKAKWDTTGVISLFLTIFVSSHMTASILFLNPYKPEYSCKGGIFLEYDGTGGDGDAAD
ncbi:hypothetical protein DIPPA_32244 [Diplonema papillatum]|nr:hypothetical protein DIPPA_16422 [Diplonema papillatum]KAJ9445087.1 hypothetical protein DIPPA_32244 [Diplonema papillatum]